MDIKEIGVGGVVKEGIFTRFPELVPHFGDSYDNSPIHRKLLLIAESNYFGSELKLKSVFTDAEQWYKGNKVPLIPEEMEVAVSNDIYYKTFNRAFNIMTSLLHEKDSNYNIYSLKDSSFYNYFLRPALKEGRAKGFSKVCQDIDRQVAGEALMGIIEIKKPDLIIFLSKFAYLEFNKYLKQSDLTNNISALPVIEYVSHPSSIWWNRNDGIYGKQKFIDILRKHWIID